MSIPVPSLHSPPALQSPAGQLWDPPPPGCAERGPNQAPLHPAQACPSPKTRVLDAISGFPASTASSLQCWGSTGLSQPRSSLQGIPLAASTRLGCRAPAPLAQGQAAGPSMLPWALPGITRLLHKHGRAWTGVLHPPVTVHPSSASQHPTVLCPLRRPATSLQSHQPLCPRGHPGVRCQGSLSFWRDGAKPSSRLEGDRQTPRLHTLPPEQADPCPHSCQGPKPPAPQPTAGSGGRGSCTAPPWPPWEVRVAPKPSCVPWSWGAGSSLQQSLRNSRRGLRCLSSKRRSPRARPSGGCHRPLRAAW